MSELKRVTGQKVQSEARRYALAMLERMVSIGLGDEQANGKPPSASAQLDAQKYVIERGLGRIPEKVTLDVDVNVKQMSQARLRDIVAGKMLDGPGNESYVTNLLGPPESD